MEKHAKKRASLLEGPEGRHLLRLALPMVAGILAMMGFNMIDTFFVARLGTLPLAAMTLTFPLVMVAGSVSLGISVSTSIAVSRAFGGNRPEDVKRLTTDAVALGILVSIIFAVIGFFLLNPVLHAIEGDLPTHELARSYMVIWLFGTPFFFLQMIGNMAIRATGDTVTPSVLIILGVVINAVLDPLLIFGVGPLPRLGIAGAAWATLIARGCTCIAVLWLLRVRKRMLISPFAGLRVVLGTWRTLLKNALPIGLNNLITPVQRGILTRLLAGLGAPVVAGYGVAIRVESFTLTCIFALQSVIGIFIGQNVGANRWDRVSRGVRFSEVFALLNGLVSFFLLVSFGKYIARAFNSETDVVRAAYVYFMVVGVTFGSRAVYLAGSAALNSLHHAVDATVITIVYGFIVTVAAAWVGSYFWGAAGLFVGLALGNLVGGLGTHLWLRRIVRRETEASGMLR
jgi:putative MATE family efflux protein